MRPWIAALAALSSAAALEARGESYDHDRTFSVEQLRQDFTLLRGALEEAHPSLYWFTAKDELDHAFQAAGGAR